MQWHEPSSAPHRRASRASRAAALRRLCKLGVAALAATTFIAVHAAGRIYVSSEKDNTITVLDGAKGDFVSSPVVCKRPRHMLFLPDHKLLVACGEDNSIVVWDPAANKVLARLDVGDDPEAFDLSPDGRTVYVSNEEDSALTAYDLAGRKKLFQVKIGGEPEGVKASPDGKLVYVTSEVANLVHVIDVAKRAVVKNIAVGKRPRRLLLAGGELWVTNELDASVSVIRTGDHTVQGRISFLPTGMRSEDVTPVGMALAPDGRTAYVALGRANHVAVVDVATRQVKAYVLVGKRPWGLALSRDGSRLYVTNGQSDDLTIVDTAALKALRTVQVGREPYTAVVDE
jgi:PQQ-dependent catabolism-associated beta-propeller protein